MALRRSDELQRAGAASLLSDALSLVGPMLDTLYALGPENGEASLAGDDPGQETCEAERIARMLADRVGIDPDLLGPVAPVVTSTLDPPSRRRR